LRTWLTCILATIFLVAFFVGPTGTISYVQAASCSPAGDTGLTAAVVAKSNQVITGMINAAGCDIGIYVGPGIEVVIANATVTGANDHGILVQDTMNTVIENSRITANGIAPHSACPFGTASTPSKPCIANDYEVLLVGTSHALVKGNTVSFNPADGGIAVADDGPANPGAPNPGTPHQSIANIITENLVEDNIPGCGILVASYNSGPSAGAVGNIVTWNLVLGSTPDVGPYNGQIVMAANAPNTVITDTIISNNIVKGSMLPGIAVHANAPGDVISHTTMENNLVSNNGYYPPEFASPNTPTGSNGTVGISLVAEAAPGMPSPPTITGTSIMSNTIVNDMYGVWTCNAANTNIMDLRGNASIPMVDCHAPLSLPSTTVMTSEMSSTSISQNPSIGSSNLILMAVIVIGLLAGVGLWRKRGKRQ
jgi:Right handed beta helix region